MGGGPKTDSGPQRLRPLSLSPIHSHGSGLMWKHFPGYKEPAERSD